MFLVNLCCTKCKIQLPFSPNCHKRHDGAAAILLEYSGRSWFDWCVCFTSTTCSSFVSALTVTRFAFWINKSLGSALDFLTADILTCRSSLNLSITPMMSPFQQFSRCNAAINNVNWLHLCQNVPRFGNSHKANIYYLWCDVYEATSLFGFTFILFWYFYNCL